MYLIVLIVGVLLGGFVYKSNLLNKILNKYRFFPKNKYFEIQFRLLWLSQPSIFTADVNGDLIKTKPITIRIVAESEHDALIYLNELLLQEVKPDLIAIKEIDEQIPTNN